MHQSESKLDASEREQTLEERPVLSQGDPEIFGRNLVAAAPLVLERAALVGEDRRQPFDHQGDQRVGLLDGPARLVNEDGLDRITLCPITGIHLVLTQLW